MTDESMMSKLTVAELRRLLLRYKWLVILTAVVGLLAAGLVYAMAPTLHRSQARLLVRYVTDTRLLDPATSAGRVMSPDSRGDNVINSEIEILTSQDLAASVAGRLDLDRFLAASDAEGIFGAATRRLGRQDDRSTATNAPPASMGLATRLIQNHLGIEIPRRSSVIRVYFDHRDPSLAQEVLAKLVEEYLAKHFRVHRSIEAHEFLTQQTDQLRTRLQQTEEELRRIQGPYGIGSVSEAMTALSTRHELLQTTMWQVEADLAASVARESVLRRSLNRSSPTSTGTPPPGTNVYPERSSPRDLLRQLKDRELQLLGTYTEDSPMVMSLRQRIQEIELLLGDAQGSDTLAPLGLPSTEGSDIRTFEQTLIAQASQSQAMQAKLGVVSNQLTAVQQLVQSLQAVETRIAALERRKALDESNYQYFSQTLEKARIDEALDASKISNISVVQAASYPAAPLRPESLRIVMGLLAFAIFGGLGMAFVIEFFLDHRLKRSMDVNTHLGLPLLVSVPFVGLRRSLLGRPKGQIKLLPGGEDGADPSKSWYMQNDLLPYWEALRDRVLRNIKPPQARPCFIGVTGCERGNGATTVAAGLAFALSRNGDGRVLLIDANTDYTSARRLFSAEASPCVMDLLSDGRGNTAVIQPNLFLLSAREVDSKMPVLSSSEKIEDLILHVGTQQYDFIICDLPHVAETSLVLRLASTMQGIILVAEAEKTNRALARHARDLLIQSQAHVMGAVLNKHREDQHL